VRFKVDLPAVTADERRHVLNQCQRVAPPVFGCCAAWFDLAPTEIAFREQLAASLRQQAVPQGPGVPTDPPAARTSRLPTGNLGLNSTGTLQGFHQFPGRPAFRPGAPGTPMFLDHYWRFYYTIRHMIDPATMPERCYTMLKSLNAFDKKEIRGIVQGLLAKTDRDTCFIGNYYRAAANVETLLSLKSAKDLQAIAMVARGLFELAVDIKLIDVTPNAVQKLIAFSDVEKLRAARKIVKFKSANPAAEVDATIYDTFITDNAQRIEAERDAAWPGVKRVGHWSGLRLSQRVALLKAPFDEIYEVNYPELSWYVHAGLTGFVNLQAKTFDMLAAKQNKLAAECYIVLLTAIIDEFGIEKADAKIKNKLKLANMLPFTDGPDEAQALELELLG